MARCEDWPCCGHEDGCCPDFDEAGNQLNMVCVCGKKLPITNHVSICDACLRNAEDAADEFDQWDERWDEDEDEEDWIGEEEGI